MPDDALRLRVIDAIGTVPEAAWDALLDEACTPFQKHRWLHAMEREGCAVEATGWHPRHLTLWRGPTLVAAAPAYAREDSQGEFVFDHGWANAAHRAGIRYYPKLVLAVPFTPATGRRVLVAPGEDRAALSRAVFDGALALAKAEKLSSVHMLFPTADEAALAASAGAMTRLGVQYHWDNPGYADYDAFLARFDSKRRNQLRREARAAAEQGVVLSTRRGDALSADDAALAYRLYLSTVDKFMWGRRYLNEGFFRRVLTDFREHVELVEARRGDEVIAGAINVASPTHLYGRYWGCFEELPFLHFNVCYYHSIRECIARGVRRFEGGAGGEHKVTRGFEPSVTHSSHWVFHRGLDQAVREFVGRESAAIEAALPSMSAATGMRPSAPAARR
ncbi:MAG: hypothetical protein JWM10_4235 [Myxococcaceae bacterium]|nr:hypothetical protein [Myxococcaceae bacterium]